MSLEEYPRMNIDPYTVYCMPAYTLEPNTSMYNVSSFILPTWKYVFFFLYYVYFILSFALSFVVFSAEYVCLCVFFCVFVCLFVCVCLCMCICACAHTLASEKVKLSGPFLSVNCWKCALLLSLQRRRKSGNLLRTISKQNSFKGQMPA